MMTTRDRMEEVTTVATETHPCFNQAASHSHVRVHLPVAPACNIQCRFCNRAYDCMNESRPGVTSAVLRPHLSLLYLERILEKLAVHVVGIAGPGDPMANPAETLETLRMVHRRYPDLMLCLATNGLDLLPHIGHLKEAGVGYVSVTVNAVDPDIAARIYRWVRFSGTIYRDYRAAEILIENQLAAIREAKHSGMIVKINTIVIPGINDLHVAAIAETVKGLGADRMNCMGLIPVKGTEFEHITQPGCHDLETARAAAARHLPQISHCGRCRADAAGRIGRDAEDTRRLLAEVSQTGSCGRSSRSAAEPVPVR